MPSCEWSKSNESIVGNVALEREEEGARGGTGGGARGKVAQSQMAMDGSSSQVGVADSELAAREVWAPGDAGTAYKTPTDEGRCCPLPVLTGLLPPVPIHFYYLDSLLLLW